MNFKNKMNDSVSAREHRKQIVLAICREYSCKVEETTVMLMKSSTTEQRIVVFIHEKWRLPLEDRIRPHGWRYAKISKWAEFRILTLVDSYR